MTGELPENEEVPNDNEESPDNESSTCEEVSKEPNSAIYRPVLNKNLIGYVQQTYGSYQAVKALFTKENQRK